MNPNNSGFIVEDELNESDFSDVSSGIGMDPKEMVKKIRKLEEMAIKNANGTNVGEQLGMMQIGWQMGKEIGELENKMDGMKDGMAKMKEELNELKAENNKLKEENAEKGNEMERMKKEIVELKAQIVGKNAEFVRKIVEKENKIEKLETEVNGLKKENAEKVDEMEGMKKAREELKEENGRKLSEMAELIAQIGGNNAKLDGQIAALKGENAKLQGKTSDLENQFDNLPSLTKIIDGIQWARYNFNEYKSHLKVGPKLTISRKELIAKHVGPNGTNIILANMPIPGFNSRRKNKLTTAFYFEMEILSSKTNGNAGIVIGFCGKNFPLEGNWLGNENTDSIGIRQKGVMQIDGCLHKFGNANGYFSDGDFVGIGIIHKTNSKMECFGTWNGKLLGKVELPPKFVDLPLFPAINLYYADDSIRINFDMEKLQFRKFGHALQ